MTVRVRGIYATALTAVLDDVVQASPTIRERFDGTIPVEPAAVTVETTDDRQGIGVSGRPERCATVVETVSSLARDTFTWEAALPRGGVFAGEVTETLGSGALVDCGSATGFLPYSKVTRRIETGERLRVQVRDPMPPWRDGRPVLDTTIRIDRPLATLVRGGRPSVETRPELVDVLPTDPPEGWGVEWDPVADDASLDVLDETLDRFGRLASSLDDAFTDAEPPAEAAPAEYWSGDETHWVWFGRETRFELDERRRSVVPTMPGHHRIKAGTPSASTAVDFVERVYAGARNTSDSPPGNGNTEGNTSGEMVGDTESDVGGEMEGDSESDAESDTARETGRSSSATLGSGAFPFEAVADTFGPRAGETVSIGHGKPDGRRIELGRAAVTGVGADGEVTLRRELSGSGTYDALGVEKHEGDVAITKVKEGRWWYPTVYTGADGQRRGTYVNICTPVEVFPDEVRYVDLHVDVVKHVDGRVERVDEDELATAVERGHLSRELAERAIEVASAIEQSLG